mmetsp:Transcript_108102/g.338126  ORF Transcript_108102/g.338126 Transcript_108102/m.338126 type:complete len:582 (+) Transcript_108102:141-1886(+)
MKSPRDRSMASTFGCCGFRRRQSEETAPLGDRRGSDLDHSANISEEEQLAALEALARVRTLATRRRPSIRPQSDTLQVETMLAAARGRIELVLSRGWLFSGTRKELEASASLLEAAEHELQVFRLAKAERGGRRGAVFCHSDPLIGLMETEPVVGPAADSMCWLLQTFTAADIEAAEGHHSATPPRACSSVRRLLSRRMRSHEELDQSLSAALSDPPAELLLERAGGLDFDTLAFAALPNVAWRPLQVLGAHALDRSNIVRALYEQGQVPDAPGFHLCLIRFLGNMDELYKADVPYHGAAHGADVLMTMEWFLQSAYLRGQVSPLDHLMVLIASAIHDVGHPGRSNLFLAKTMAPQAVTYNDKSILENMHVSLSFEIMRNDPSCDWFEMFPQDFRPQGAAQEAAVNLHQYVRKGLVHMVLATDMAKHAKSMQDLKIFVEEQGEAEVLEDGHERKQEALAQKLFLMETVVHAADISNPTKPRPMMLQWTQRILQEFWNQGDEERRLELPISPLCDRAAEQAVVPKGQLGFINFVIQPLFGNLAKLIPEVQEATDQLEQNRAFWEEKDREQATYEQIFGVKPA